ncbi:MAG: methyltransferase domain-containing protein [Chloroflexi bacterium]|nr:methyltransferase domain-containing protein [Chloroflexota bacterium]
MNHDDHVNLLRGGVPESGGVWADLGSGAGAFTLALADLLGPSAEIYSVDKDRAALAGQERVMRARFPSAAVHYLAADFTNPLDLPLLDGVVMANSLHFHRDHDCVFKLIRTYLKPSGRLVVVEYNIDRGNLAVPHPLPFRAWQNLARRAGFGNTQLLSTRPSRFLREIYSAVSW